MPPMDQLPATLQACWKAYCDGSYPNGIPTDHDFEVYQAFLAGAGLLSRLRLRDGDQEVEQLWAAREQAGKLEINPNLDLAPAAELSPWEKVQSFAAWLRFQWPLRLGILRNNLRMRLLELRMRVLEFRMFLFERQMLHLEFLMESCGLRLLLKLRLQLLLQRVNLIAQHGRHWRLGVAESDVIEFLQMEKCVHAAILRRKNILQQAKLPQPE